MSVQSRTLRIRPATAVLAVASILTAFSYAPVQSAPQRPTNSIRESKALDVQTISIVKAILSYIRANGDKGTIVFVRDMRGHNDVAQWRSTRKQYPDSVPNRLFERYASDQSPSRVFRKISGVRKVVWVRDADIKATFGAPKDLVNGWRRFHRKYPHACGVVYIGSPVLSEDGLKGLISFGLQRSFVGGYGGVLYLQKMSGNWKIIGRLDAYVS